MAIGAMRELQAAGLRVPADIAVTGFDDIHLGALLAPPLTTVHQPMRLLGERACAMVLDRIADPTLPRRVERLPTELVVRESCGCTTAALRQVSGFKAHDAGGRRITQDHGERAVVRVPARLYASVVRVEHPRGQPNAAQVPHRQ